MSRATGVIKVEVTLANGRTTVIEHSVRPGYYTSDMYHLYEMYGEDNVKEIG